MNLFLKILLLSAAVVMTACGKAGTPDYTITPEGVGPLTLTAETVDFGEGYETVSETIVDEMDGYSETILTIADSEGNVVARRLGNYMIEVVSSDFKTSDGIHAGMPVAELENIRKNIYVRMLPDMGRAFRLFSEGNIGFKVDGDRLKGGSEAFDNFYMNPGDITVDDFSPGTKIESIIISE